MLTAIAERVAFAAILRRTVAAVAFVCAMLCLFTASVAASEIPRGPLDELWESHMLAGTGASYYDGEKSTVPHAGSFEMTKGSPDAVWPNLQGIRVQDFRETAFGGPRVHARYRQPLPVLGRRRPAVEMRTPD